jgi:hypothetical protein
LILCSSLAGGSLPSERFSGKEEAWFVYPLGLGPAVAGRGDSAANVRLSLLASMVA